MRNLWSAKAPTAISRRTSTTNDSTLKPASAVIDHDDAPNQESYSIDMPSPSSATGVGAIHPSNLSPLGRPDAHGFSTPGAVESESNEGIGEQQDENSNVVAAITGSGDTLVTVTVISEPRPQSTVIVIGTPTASVPPQTPITFSQPPPPPRRSQSAVSTRSANGSISSAYDICRICHCEGSSDAPLIFPCSCSGSLKYVHQKCLQQWIKSSQTRSCEVCRFTFIMETKVKPFRKWEKLDISAVERRKILCSVTFHIVAITCVIWSLYVLIDRTAEEIRAGTLDWPFWTKLVVVAIGFTGGLVFMYVQCKMYVQLFRRWQSYNKVIFVQNGPAGGGGGTTAATMAAAGSTTMTTGPVGGKYVATSNITITTTTTAGAVANGNAMTTTTGGSSDTVAVNVSSALNK